MGTVEIPAGTRFTLEDPYREGRRNRDVIPLVASLTVLAVVLVALAVSLQCWRRRSDSGLPLLLLQCPLSRARGQKGRVRGEKAHPGATLRWDTGLDCCVRHPALLLPRFHTTARVCSHASMCDLCGPLVCKPASDCRICCALHAAHFCMQLERGAAAAATFAGAPCWHASSPCLAGRGDAPLRARSSAAALRWCRCGDSEAPA
jgi:hypothetical protein